MLVIGTKALAKGLDIVVGALDERLASFIVSHILLGGTRKNIGGLGVSKHNVMGIGRQTRRAAGEWKRKGLTGILDDMSCH